MKGINNNYLEKKQVQRSKEIDFLGRSPGSRRWRGEGKRREGRKTKGEEAAETEQLGYGGGERGGQGRGKLEQELAIKNQQKDRSSGEESI